MVRRKCMANVVLWNTSFYNVASWGNNCLFILPRPPPCGVLFWEFIHLSGSITFFLYVLKCMSLVASVQERTHVTLWMLHSWRVFSNRKIEVEYNLFIHSVAKRRIACVLCVCVRPLTIYCPGCYKITLKKCLCVCVYVFVRMSLDNLSTPLLTESIFRSTSGTEA